MLPTRRRSAIREPLGPPRSVRHSLSLRLRSRHRRADRTSSGGQLGPAGRYRSGDNAPGGCSGVFLCARGQPTARENRPGATVFRRRGLFSGKTTDRRAGGDNGPDPFVRGSRVLSLPKRGLYGGDGRTNQRGSAGSSREEPGGKWSRRAGSDPPEATPHPLTSGSTARWFR